MPRGPRPLVNSLLTDSTMGCRGGSPALTGTRQTPGVPLQDYRGHHSLWLIKDGWFSKPLTLIPTAQMECRNPPYGLKTTLLFMWEYVKADP